LGEVDQVDDPVTLGQMILSCVLRLEQRFGADHTAKVLIGSNEQRVLQLGHDRLSTYGLLKEQQLSTVRGWIEQLISQQFLMRDGEHQTLRVTASGMRLLRREETPALSRAIERKAAAPRHTAADHQSWEGVDRGLFEELKRLRLQLAQQRKVPAYVIFGDATLRELARVRPSTYDRLRMVRGIGQQKLQDFGQTFLKALDAYCGDAGLTRDCKASPAAAEPAQPALKLLPGVGAGALAALEYFRKQMPLEAVAEKMNRARSTVAGYLCEYLRHDRVTDPSPWVNPELIAVIEEALSASSDGRLKPIFEQLEGKASYEEIRIVLTCRQNRLAATEAADAV
jgi:ATP-dependent DNA helicase RecQ